MLFFPRTTVDTGAPGSPTCTFALSSHQHITVFDPSATTLFLKYMYCAAQCVASGCAARNCRLCILCWSGNLEVKVKAVLLYGFDGNLVSKVLQNRHCDIYAEPCLRSSAAVIASTTSSVCLKTHQMNYLAFLDSRSVNQQLNPFLNIRLSSLTRTTNKKGTPAFRTYHNKHAVYHVLKLANRLTTINNISFNRNYIFYRGDYPLY